MKKYVFYDTGVTGFEEYDIDGEDYVRLLSVCVSYCTSFSLRLTYSDTLLPSGLYDDRIPLNENCKRMFDCYFRALSEDTTFCRSGFCTNIEDGVFHFRVTDKTVDIILSISHSVFTMGVSREYKRPEDLTFYRDDGSVFFYFYHS